MGLAPEFDSAEAAQALARALSRDADVAAAWLYGSRARGGARRGSDVDVAVMLRAGVPAAHRWRKRLEYADALACALGTDDVDVVILEEAPAALAHRIVRDGLLVVDHDPQRRVQVVEDALRRYLDEAALRAALDEGLRERLREGRFAR